MSEPKYKLELNLDDDAERDDFLLSIQGKPAQAIADLLEFKGADSLAVANSLRSYAIHKDIASKARAKGMILKAIRFEERCDIIYKEEINPFVECW